MGYAWGIYTRPTLNPMSKGPIRILPLLTIGFVHSRPEALYFWFYFVFLNGLWIVIPTWVIVHCMARVGGAVAAADRNGATAGKHKAL